MSSCLSGGGGGRAAAYGFDLEIVKSPSSTSTTTRAASHNTPSPSSTLSESNSPLTISTRKPRTPRKRPNQTYNEAAALLSTTYPNIFSSNNLSAKKTPTNSQFFGFKSHHNDYNEASELLLPFGSIEEQGFLFHAPLQPKSDLFFEHKEAIFRGKSGGAGEIDDSEANRVELFDDFDAESILDEEIEEGIDSIMGNVGSNDGEIHRNGESRGHALNSGGNCYGIGRLGQMMMNPWFGNPIGIGFRGNFQLGFGLRSALRDIDDANWWRFPTVDFDQISPRIRTTATTTAGNSKSPTVDNSKKKAVATTAEKKKKKKKKVAPPAPAAESKSSEWDKEDPDSNPNQNPGPEQRSGLLLKLNYDSVLDAWSDKASPFSDEILGPDAAGTDVHARLAQIDLFGEGGVREASVLRYKEKRRTRLFSKKIRYEVRKLNADQRPRIKGRFVRRPNATNPGGQR